MHCLSQTIYQDYKPYSQDSVLKEETEVAKLFHYLETSPAFFLWFNWNTVWFLHSVVEKF